MYNTLLVLLGPYEKQRPGIIPRTFNATVKAMSLAAELTARLGNQYKRVIMIII